MSTLNWKSWRVGERDIEMGWNWNLRQLLTLSRRSRTMKIVRRLYNPPPFPATLRRLDLVLVDPLSRKGLSARLPPPPSNLWGHILRSSFGQLHHPSSHYWSSFQKICSHFGLSLPLYLPSLLPTPPRLRYHLRMAEGVFSRSSFARLPTFAVNPSDYYL